MRATSFFSGLLLTSVVFAAPTPRPSDDIEGANPFNNEKRAGLPVDLPVKLPVVDTLTGELDGLTSKLPLGDITKDLPVKLPVRAFPALPVDLPIGDVEKTVDGVTKGLPIKLPSLPELPGLPVRRDLLDTLGPLLKPVQSLLGSLINTLTNADANAQKLVGTAEGAAGKLVASIEADLDDAVNQLQATLTKVTEQGNGAIDSVQDILKSVEALAGQLVTDLESVQSSVPDVASLVNTAKGLVATVQSLGL